MSKKYLMLVLVSLLTLVGLLFASRMHALLFGVRRLD